MWSFNAEEDCVNRCLFSVQDRGETHKCKRRKDEK